MRERVRETWGGRKRERELGIEGEMESEGEKKRQ